MADNNNTPQLGELAAAGQSQAPVATIAPTDSSQMVHTLNQNAKFQANFNWNKYLNFQSNLKDAYANVAAIEQMEVMAKDKEELQKGAADLYNFIAKNPDAFSGRNPQLHGEMQAMYGNLVSKATLSKQDNLFDKANRAYLVANNELNSDENKKLIEGFAETPLGTRKAYTLSLEPIFDAGTFSETLKTNIGKQYSPIQKTAPTNFDPATGKYTAGEDYIRTTETVTVPFKDYMDRWNASLSMQTDKNGQPVGKWAQKQYDTLPEDVKSKISLPEFWSKIGEKLYGSDKDEQGNIKDIVKTTKDELKENANFLKKDKLELDKQELGEKKRHQKVMEAIGWFNAKTSRQKAEKDLEAEANGVPGNALNDVELDANVKPGEYNMTGAGNKQRLANIQRLLGTTKDKYGKDIPILTDEQIKSRKEKDAIRYRVEKIDGKPVVTEIKINNKWYDRGYFRNKQLEVDHEPMKGEKSQYKTGQALKGEKKRKADYPTNIQNGIQALMEANGITEEEAIEFLKDNNRLD